ncbi:phage tail tape measure protein [Streptococcus jiangjianxini]|uniref:phage tail tape measure protein n=1 Tax=Streptococcus jiangjianxini TaxID=3161189 RepID=UPI0032EEAC86
MSSNIGDLVATATLDIAPFISNTKNLKTHMKSLDNSLRAVEKSYKGSGNKLNGLRAIYNQTGRSLTGYQSLLSKQTAHYNKLKADIGDVNKATAEQKSQLLGAQSAMTATASKVAELQSKYNSLGKEIAVQSSIFTRVGDKLQSVGGKLQTVGDSAQSVGRSFTRGLTTPMVAGAGLAIKAAVDYESAFAGVRKTVDASEAGYRKLSDGIRQMAKEMPASAAEIAHVAETAGQLGIKQNDILAFTKTMIDMGESTNLSADEAATSIAKIGNILGLTSAEYSRFGSSVVALGNNFATTEKDVVEMSNRLAASGKLAGLTAPEILGLATAMSSVGIEAEAGGTAMSQTLTQIGQAVDTGGDKLNKLAEIAGMTAEQFSAKWKEKPIEAVEAFIKGLGNLGNEGESASSVLDELGMSGIRQSNMLKSLGLASDKVSDAVKTSSEAWKENSALTDEASKRYETTQSKLKILKNKATDVAIELGGPLADALTDVLEAGEPLIENIADLAKQFSSLDKEQQQQIIKWGLIAAGIGPALSIFGKATSVIGGTIGAFGKLSSGIGKISGMTNAATTIGDIGASAEGAAGGAGLLGGKLSGVAAAIMSPVGLVAGAALLAGGLVALGKAKDHAREKAEEWGTTLDGKTKTELNNFKSKVDETNTAIVNFDSKGTPAVENVKKAFADLFAEIEKSQVSANSRLEELGKKLGLTDEQIQKGKDRNQQIVDNAREMTDQIKTIYDKHNGDVSQLTAAEKAIVENNQRELVNAKLSLMDLSNKQEMAVRQAFSNDISTLNETQLKKTMSALEKAMTAERKAYKQKNADLKEALEAGMITQEEYNARKTQNESEHQATMDALGEKYAKAAEARDAKARARLRDNTTNYQVNAEKAKKFLQDVGLSYDELANKVDAAAKKGGKGTELLAQSTANMTKETKEANALWSSLTFDEKKMEVKSNAIEEVIKASQSEEGWNQLMFMMKEANLSTNARMQVAEALQANGDWNDMTPEEKKLVVNGQEGMLAILESKKHLETWNSMPEEVKNLLGENKDFTSKAETAKAMLDHWNSLSPEMKKLYAENLTQGGVAAAKWEIDTLKNKNVLLGATDNTLEPTTTAKANVDSVKQVYGPVQINAEDKTSEASTSAQSNVNLPHQLKPIDMFGADKTMAAVALTSKSVNSPKQKSPIGMFGANKTGPAVNSAKSSVNSVKDKTVTIRANDQASGVIKGIKGWVDSLKDKWVNIFTRHTKNEKGTNYHPGGLAMVNDQKGPTYRELVTLPSGQSFIPEGRDVMLPLPRGSKVLRASETKKLFPRYADGIGFENTNISKLAQRMGTVNSGVIVEQQANQDNDLRRLIFELVDAIKSSNNDKTIAQALDIAEQAVERPVNLYLQDGAWMGRVADRLSKHQSSKALINNRLRGEI